MPVTSVLSLSTSENSLVPSPLSGVQAGEEGTCYASSSSLLQGLMFEGAFHLHIAVLLKMPFRRKSPLFQGLSRPWAAVTCV